MGLFVMVPYKDERNRGKEAKVRKGNATVVVLELNGVDHFFTANQLRDAITLVMRATTVR